MVMVRLLHYMKYILAMMMAIVLAIVLLLAYADFRYFQPIAQQYNKVLLYPNSVSKLLNAANGQSFKYLVARELLRNPDTGRAARGYLKVVAWGLFVDIHLSQEEQVNVIGSSVYLGAGTYGFFDAARKFFNKKLSELSPREVALLVERMRAHNHPEQLEQLEQLEQRAGNLLRQAGYAS